MRNAFIDYPHPGINYEKVLVSRGYLWNTQKATARAATGAISYNWTNDSGVGGAHPNDKCILVAYFETANRCVFTADGGERQSGEAKLPVIGFRAQIAHTWLGFNMRKRNHLSGLALVNYGGLRHAKKQTHPAKRMRFLITKTTVMKKSIKYYFIVLPHSVS